MVLRVGVWTLLFVVFAGVAYAQIVSGTGAPEDWLTPAWWTKPERISLAVAAIASGLSAIAAIAQLMSGRTARETSLARLDKDFSDFRTVAADKSDVESIINILRDQTADPRSLRVVPHQTLAAGPRPPAVAQNLATFGKWTAWKSADTHGDMYFVSGCPEVSEPRKMKRGPVHFLVVHRAIPPVRNEVQVLAGYTFKKNADASASIDGATFPMVTEGQAAWLARAAFDPVFVSALRTGTVLVIEGTNRRGVRTADAFNLEGIDAAMDVIDKASE